MFPSYIIQLKVKEIIYISNIYRTCSGNLIFYNLDILFNKVGNVNDVYTCNQNGIVKLDSSIIVVTVLESFCGVVI